MPQTNSSSTTRKSPGPFLKWAGGKRWLVETYGEIFPVEYGRYIEPFLGGGAIFFHLLPQRARLSDLNGDLVECYKQIRDCPSELQALLGRHQAKHCKDHYYEVRSTDPKTKIERAARFLYLNRTCWNGLYRVNLKGQFNVPIGTKNTVLLSSDDFSHTSELLENVDLVQCDFEQSLEEAEEGDLVYIDPPYTVKHNFNGFLKYNESIFSWSDQVRLHAAAVAAKQRGATVIVSNAAHQSLLDLYKNADNLQVVTRSSVLAASSLKRGQVEEILVTL